VAARSGLAGRGMSFARRGHQARCPARAVSAGTTTDETTSEASRIPGGHREALLPRRGVRLEHQRAERARQYEPSDPTDRRSARHPRQRQPRKSTLRVPLALASRTAARGLSRAALRAGRRLPRRPCRLCLGTGACGDRAIGTRVPERSAGQGDDDGPHPERAAVRSRNATMTGRAASPAGPMNHERKLTQTLAAHLRWTRRMRLGDGRVAFARRRQSDTPSRWPPVSRV
jgi:hypothetical protein